MNIIHILLKQLKLEEWHGWLNEDAFKIYKEV